jgi:hypothetical protein
MDIVNGSTVPPATAKPTPVEVHGSLRSIGISDLDAGLVADCLNVGKSTSWMNADDVPEGANEKIAAYLAEKGITNFRITVSQARTGKYIWDVKRLR